MDNDRKKLQTLSEEFQNLQAELQGNIDAQQKLDSQRQENQSVQKEFANLAEDIGIYKLLGPILLKQDRSEAAIAVNQRLAFIEKESTRIDQLIKITQGNLEKKKAEVINLQASMEQHSSGV